jgi:hypothetical protein
MSFESRHLAPIEQLAETLQEEQRSYTIRIRRKRDITIYELRVVPHGC